MNRQNLLYLNLSVDEKDISLGFAKTWTDQFSENFKNVDVITLNRPTEIISITSLHGFTILFNNCVVSFDESKIGELHSRLTFSLFK